MTTPRDAIGLSERLRRRAAVTEYCTGDPLCEEAATQLDSLLKERDALQARVKELDGRYLGAVAARGMLRDRADEAESRATRLQQERDEAYERAAIYIEQREGMIPDWRGFVAELRSLAAGPEKEKKE